MTLPGEVFREAFYVIGFPAELYDPQTQTAQTRFIDTHVMNMHIYKRTSGRSPADLRKIAGRPAEDLRKTSGRPPEDLRKTSGRPPEDLLKPSARPLQGKLL